MWDISVSSPQLCSESKISLKNKLLYHKIYFLKIISRKCDKWTAVRLNLTALALESTRSTQAKITALPLTAY